VTTLPPLAPPEEPAPPPPRGRDGSLVVAAVAVVVVVALVAGIVVLVTRDDGGEGGEAAPSTTTEAPPEPSSSTTSPPDELEEAVRELSDFVAEERGRPFEQPVDVELLDDAAFVDRLRSLSEEDVEAVEESGRLLRAIGLLDADDDLSQAVDRATAQGVLGFYDPEDDALVVRGSDLSPGVRSTLVHELTHAWDDQHFELHRPALDEADDESAFAFSTLLEGNAVRVEEAWAGTLSSEERAQLRSEEGTASERLGSADVPPIVLQLLSLPYAAGPSFVEELLRSGGEARVDAAFAAPPTTSEQVLDPDKYLDGPERAVSVPEPAADGPVTDRGVFGAAGVLLTLVDGIPAQDARLAAGGWGGDRYVTWEAGDETCVRLAVVGDRPTDTRELARAWTDWAEGVADAEVEEADGRVVVTSCG
jgi:hypothetical protein